MESPTGIDIFPSSFWQDDNWYHLTSLPPDLLSADDFLLPHPHHIPTADENPTSYSTPSSDSLSDTPTEIITTTAHRLKKRRQPSSDCFPQSDALVRTRKTRKLRDPQETAKTREKGACFLCQKKRKECQDGDDPDGPCRRCSEHSNKMTVIPGLLRPLRPLCWRPNIGYTEVFRRGPTIDFAASLRGNREDAGPGKQALWKQFGTRKSGNETSKLVELSQNWTPNSVKIRLDRYVPMETDKQYYSWFNDDVEYRYETPPYGISNTAAATSAIERFLTLECEAYLEAHLKDAEEVTRRTFHAAQQHKHLPLVDRALKLWVGCRFIEKPWSIVGAERLGMSTDPDPNCPYHDRIPVPPILDLQFDLIVINEILQPELKKILKTMKSMLEGSDPWNNWFEIYLSYFILLHNVELTMKHDAWFVKRNNLKTRYSNKALIDTITQGANTLLTCFHYAHQGYAPFSNPELESAQHWEEEQKAYLREVRPMLARMRGDCVLDPAREMFWTSQLHQIGWRPVVLVS